MKLVMSRQTTDKAGESFAAVGPGLADDPWLVAVAFIERLSTFVKTGIQAKRPQTCL